MCVCCVCYVCYVYSMYVWFRVLTMMTRSNRRYTNDLRPCTVLYTMVLIECTPWIFSGALILVHNCTVYFVL